MSIALKSALLEKAYAFVEEKIQTYSQAMKAAQDAANGESKSSAGDKYETTRAMMQIEKDNNAKQLAETMKLKQALDLINVKADNEKSDFGSIVVTNGPSYFLSISAGIVKHDSKDYILLSPSSPIGRQLRDLKKGDSMKFNGQTFKITDIF